MSSDNFKFMTWAAYAHLFFLAFALLGMGVLDLTGDSYSSETRIFGLMALSVLGTISALTASMTRIRTLESQIVELKTELTNLKTEAE